MKFQDDILNELQILSPLLAEVQKKNVFTVPDGYFETLRSNLLISVKEKAVNQTIKIADLPEGYFENLSTAILDKIKTQQKNTIAKELVTLSEVLQSLQQKKLFDVPEGYFENLCTTILDKIKKNSNNTIEEEIKELSPLMKSLQQINVFEMPEGYFNTAPYAIIDAAKAAKITTAKIVSMPKSGFFFRYAAAAIITGVIAFGTYKYTNNPLVSPLIPEVSFAKLDSSIEKGKDMNERQFTEAFNNLTKEDITSYFEKNGSDEDISLLTNNVEVNGLPSKADYLLDEKTLENYLDKIKFQN